MRDWRMTFLPQFRVCVEAGAWSIMCSYNRSHTHTHTHIPSPSLSLSPSLNPFFLPLSNLSINGIPACANKQLLTDILRNEWGFKGKSNKKNSNHKLFFESKTF